MRASNCSSNIRSQCCACALQVFTTTGLGHLVGCNLGAADGGRHSSRHSSFLRAAPCTCTVTKILRWLDYIHPT